MNETELSKKEFFKNYLTDNCDFKIHKEEGEQISILLDLPKIFFESKIKNIELIFNCVATSVRKICDNRPDDCQDSRENHVEIFKKNPEETFHNDSSYLSMAVKHY